MLRAATQNDLPSVAELIAGQQADPARNIPYLGEEFESEELLAAEDEAIESDVLADTEV